MAKLLVCGMTPSTAKRYVIVRREIDSIIDRVNKAGHWLSEFEKVRPGDHRKILIDMGQSIMQRMAQIQDYLENEFASVDKIRAEADKLTSCKNPLI